MNMLLNKLPTTISDYIFTDLREGIINGTLKPNQTLREEEISLRFGSSRGPIRESLRLLLQTGLVVHQPRKGFKVRDYTDGATVKSAAESAMREVIAKFY